jgi:DNA-binding beta-propeller fold protein YncE
MPSDDLDTPRPLVDSGPQALSTNGAMERARQRRVALVILLSVLLAILLYVAFYYSQNRRLPVPTIVSASETVPPPLYQYSFAGTGKQAMNLPSGIGIIGNRVYVTDFAYRTVRAYSLTGAYLFTFGPISDGKTTALDSPVHIAIGPDNTVWVSDRALKGIYVFDENGRFLRKFVPNGDPTFSWGPLALAFGPNGDLYVTDVGDSANHRVLVFGSTGHLKAQWGSTKQVGSANEAPGQFLFPNGIAVTGSGSSALVYVADGNNRRVQVFRPDGRFVRIINTSGTPRGLAIDSQGRLYVVDALAHRVDLYSDKGVALTTFGQNGAGPGGMSFPNDITIDAQGRLFLADRDNNQVQVWGASVAEIPGVTRITAGNAWVPFLLVPIVGIPLVLWFRRRRRFAVAPDFVDGMIAADLVPAMAGQGRFRWVMTEADQPAYEGRTADGVELGELLHAEPFSQADASVIRDRLDVSNERAALLAIAKRCRVLCTEDPGLARQAVRLGVDVYDRPSWLARFAKKK